MNLIKNNHELFIEIEKRRIKKLNSYINEIKEEIKKLKEHEEKHKSIKECKSKIEIERKQEHKKEHNLKENESIIKDNKDLIEDNKDIVNDNKDLIRDNKDIIENNETIVNRNNTLTKNVIETELENIYSQLNINISKKYIQKIITEKYIKTKLKIKNETLIKNEYNKLKLKITKRLSQVTIEENHNNLIINDLINFKNSYKFLEYFTDILLDQCKLLVSANFESYKGYSYLIYKLYNGNTEFDIESLEYIKISIFLKDTTSIESIYSVYFGYLYYNKDIKEMWIFITSLLNEKPNKNSIMILEKFLIILGEFLYSKVDRFCDILNYIVEQYLPLSDYEPGKVRISNICKKYF